MCLNTLDYYSINSLGRKLIIITNFMGHNLVIIVMQILFFIGSYGIDMDVIHLFILFEHQCHANCLDTNFICLFILFRHECCMLFMLFTHKSCAHEFHV